MSIFTWRQQLSLWADPFTYPIARWWRDWPMRIAWWLPRRVALWAFIRVYVADGSAPGPEYIRAYDFWDKGSRR